jgi:hypothetical protein
MIKSKFYKFLLTARFGEKTPFRTNLLFVQAEGQAIEIVKMEVLDAEITVKAIASQWYSSNAINICESANTTNL